MCAEDVGKIAIPCDEKRTISFCGSAVYKVGVEGHLDLYHDNDSRIASLYWNGPWSRTYNQLDVRNLNSEYVLTMSPVQERGILGDVSIVVALPRHRLVDENVVEIPSIKQSIDASTMTFVRMPILTIRFHRF